MMTSQASSSFPFQYAYDKDLLTEEEALNYFQRYNPHDAGYDLKLYSGKETVRMDAGKRAVLNTGIRVKIPNGYVGLIKSRSCLASKELIDVKAGVIDSGYIGPLKVILHKAGGFRTLIKNGDRIAQMVIVPCFASTPVLATKLEDTQRGEKGFGSTGID